MSKVKHMRSLTAFTFNWSLWPFVEIEGDPIVSELAIISPKLRADLVQWCDLMLQNFDENVGFRDATVQSVLNQRYFHLCDRLIDEGVHFTKDTWWN
jgi:hypothetical protein